ncbi:MAG: uroporphyrinogen-III synthase [Polaromonas sp.]|nr:MAG: uroporphyrinogen-III synthase [Polaromonas sp.]
MAPRRVIVTRPLLDAGNWVQQLQQRGFGAEALPLIEIAAASGAANTQAITQAWQGIGSYAACMFVSGNAVRFFFEQKQAPAHVLRGSSAINCVANKAFEALPPSLRFMAPGPGTAAALLDAGVPVGQIDTPPPDADQFDSEALWRLVGQRDWRGRRVLIVRGVTGQDGPDSQDSQARQAPAPSSGRDWLARQWAAAGCSVDFLGVYERRAPVWQPGQLQRARLASADGSVWLFSSSEAVQHLAAMPALQGVDWHRAVAIATHPRITATARAMGWGRVAESRPALADILDTLVSLPSSLF